ncbi:MAG: UDP-N-acetylmuramoylalanyl-D-glutamyl-2, 6-diaminopimelate--D-alanyl-D-alanine ligase [Deltaproteobacteria bacterium]|nr:UDP-N-acetylmuramoylalanyl-D-glutamyl-2, 6-diaminopimelate--D-alanyl-D-alanine ligase [Deltaproteobacteria bacterium]
MATAIPENAAAFTAAEIAFATGGALRSGAPERAIVGVCTDSRAVRPGNLFCALRGESFDGHRFIDGALAAGAAAVLVERPVAEPGEAAVILVDDALAALGKLGRLHRDRWEREHAEGGVVIAITGSAGKTTTKELCAAAAAAALGDEAVLATRGNLNNRIGVPMTLFGLEARHRLAVIEMGTSVRGEIAAPDVSVLVNVGIAHAEGLATAGASPREAVAREKSAILAAAGSFAIACADDPWASAALTRARPGVSAFGFGRAANARYRMIDLTFADGRTRITLERPARRPSETDERARVSFSVPLLGQMAALDAVGALAAADAALDVLDVEAVEGAMLERTLARRVRAVPGRLALRARVDGALVLDDTYNASPDAFVASIEVARQLAAGAGLRLLIVAGEMRELGAFAERGHDEVAAKLVAARPALVATCGGFAERFADALAAAGLPVERHPDARAATAIAERVAAGDLVLVKASRGVAAEVVVDAILARGGEVPDGWAGSSGPSLTAGSSGPEVTAAGEPPSRSGGG